MDPALIRLVTEAANAEGEVLQRRDFAPRRRRFLTHVRRRRVQQRAVRWLVPLVAATALFVPALDPPSAPPALSFEVQGRPREPRDWLTSNGQVPLSVAFSDGSSVRLTGEARARVTELSGDGAGVVLEHGALKADVVHGQTTNWRFDAGPFRVRVLGTKFDMEWDPSRERFELELTEGSVAVSGPKLQARCLVQAGHRVQIELKSGAVSGPCIASEPETNATAAREPTGSAVPLPTPSVIQPPPSWQALAARGDYEAAWAAVSAAGFDQLKQRASARELMLLADLARYARKSDHATRALLELRQRFARSAEASKAAFLLGRIAADQQGAPARGAAWFATYLSERPEGAFAPEALGRLLECQTRAGQLAASRKTASRYLQLYPEGANRALARHVLDASAPPAGDEQRP